MKLVFAGYRKNPWGLHWTDDISGEFLTRWCSSEAEARAFWADELRVIEQEKELFRRSWRRSAVSRKKGVTVADAAARYMALHHMATVTKQTTSYHLRPVLRLMGGLQAHLLNMGDINAFRMAQQLRLVGNSTIRQRVSILRGVFGWAAAEGLVPNNPLTGLRLPAARSRRVVPPSLREARALYAGAAPHLKRVILMGLFTGARIGPSELFRLPWIDMDLDVGRVRMPNAAKGSEYDTRDIPLRQDILPVLRLWAEEDARREIPWVIHWKGRPVRSVAAAWSTTKRRVGITRPLRPYDLRHAFANYSLAGGADPGSVATIMGHTDTAMIFQVYQHVQDQQMIDAVGCVPMMVDLRVK